MINVLKRRLNFKEKHMKRQKKEAIILIFSFDAFRYIIIYPFIALSMRFVTQSIMYLSIYSLHTYDYVISSNIHIMYTPYCNLLKMIFSFIQSPHFSHIPYTLNLFLFFRISFIFKNSNIRRADVDGIGMLKNRGPILVLKTVAEKQRNQKPFINFNHCPLFEGIFATPFFWRGSDD